MVSFCKKNHNLGKYYKYYGPSLIRSLVQYNDVWFGNPMEGDVTSASNDGVEAWQPRMIIWHFNTRGPHEPLENPWP